MNASGSKAYAPDAAAPSGDEVFNLMDKLAIELNGAEEKARYLCDRLQPVSRPEPESAVTASIQRPQEVESVPQTRLGGDLSELARRVRTMTAQLNSALERLALP